MIFKYVKGLCNFMHVSEHTNNGKHIQMGPFEDLFSCSVYYLSKYMESSCREPTPCCMAKPPVGPVQATQILQHRGAQPLSAWILTCPNDQKQLPWNLSKPGLPQLSARMQLGRHWCQLGLHSYIQKYTKTKSSHVILRIRIYVSILLAKVAPYSTGHSCLHPWLMALIPKSGQVGEAEAWFFFIHQTNASFGSSNLKSCQIFKKQKLLWLEKNTKESEEHNLSIFKRHSINCSILNGASQRNVSKRFINKSKVVLVLANYFTHFFPTNFKTCYSHSTN